MTQYQVRVRDHTGTQIAVFSGGGRGASGGGMQWMSYRKRLRTAGQSTVSIFGDDERISLLELKDIGEPDNPVDFWVEFWRQDPRWKLEWYRDFVAWHRWDNFKQGSEGQIVYQMRGRGLNDLCAAEEIRWYRGSTQASKNAAAESAAKEYAGENIGPGATVVAGRDRAGNFQGLTVEGDMATGTTWTGDRANDALIDVLQELAEFAPGDFNIVPMSYHPDAITMQFQWRDNQWGQDKTWGNAGGLPAVVFSPQNNNVEDLDTTMDRLDEVNVCDVGGKGAGVTRPYTYSTTGAENDSPWARRAVFRQGSNTNTAAARTDLADRTLNEQRAKRKMSFDVKQTEATRYGRDYDIGDLVTVQFLGRSYDKKILGITPAWASTGSETISLEVEDA